jgi:hypothetical protein
MAVIWAAIFIAAVLAFVIHVLAQHWQKLLRDQSWTIRRLLERVRNLESMADPMFLQRLNEASPMPLEQVYTLTLRLDDHFWSDAVRASEEDRAFIRENGSFVGSIKIERWRSHTVVTVKEVLPDKKASGWQTRSLDFYSDPARNTDTFQLWEIALSRSGLSLERPPYLELILHGNSIELWGHLASGAGRPSGNGRHGTPDREDVIFFRVPLDMAQLAEFRSHDPAEAANGHGNPIMFEPGASGKSWRAFYSDRDDALGFEWQLRVHDLTKRSEWERWKILESGPPIPLERD